MLFLSYLLMDVNQIYYVCILISIKLRGLGPPPVPIIRIPTWTIPPIARKLVYTGLTAKHVVSVVRQVDDNGFDQDCCSIKSSDFYSPVAVGIYDVICFILCQESHRYLFKWFRMSASVIKPCYSDYSSYYCRSPQPSKVYILRTTIESDISTAG